MKRRSWWDLLDDEHTGRLQAAKCWLHVGNTAGTIKFLLVPAAQMTTDMLTAYLGIVAVGYGGMYWLTGKRRQDGTNSDMAEGADSTASLDTAGGIMSDGGMGNTQAGCADTDREVGSRAKKGGGRSGRKSGKG